MMIKDNPFSDKERIGQMLPGQMLSSQPHVEGDPELFSQTLVPHRSLSKRGLTWLLMAFAGIGLGISLPFFWLGAWPVAGFFGIDVLLLYVAFRANMRSARAYEQILLTHVELLFRKVSAKGQARFWRFNPGWVRLHTEAHEEFGIQKVALIQGQRQVEVGRFLGAAEKEAFALSFKQALGEARRGRTYNP